LVFLFYFLPIVRPIQPEKLSAYQCGFIRVFFLVGLLCVSYFLFYVFQWDLAILHSMWARAFLTSLISKVLPFAFGLYLFTPLIFIYSDTFIYILPHEEGEAADSEDSLQSTARSHQQPAADAAAVPPGGAAQPQGPIPGVPVAVGSPEAIQLLQEIFSKIEPRVNELAERAGLVIGTEEQHLAFLHQMAFSIVHDIEPLTNPNLEVLQGLNANLEQNPRLLDSLIRDGINNRNPD